MVSEEWRVKSEERPAFTLRSCYRGKTLELFIHYSIYSLCCKIRTLKDFIHTLFLAMQDFHPSDMYRIASCGMDNTVKIWSMKGRALLLFFLQFILKETFLEQNWKIGLLRWLFWAQFDTTMDMFKQKTIYVSQIKDVKNYKQWSLIILTLVILSWQSI